MKHTTVLTVLAAVLPANCAAPRARTPEATSQQLSFSPAARDRVSRALHNVIEVVRRPARADSAWVALVRTDSRDTNAIVGFVSSAPHFLTWILNNTNHTALLASLPATAPAATILYDSLVADPLFIRTMIVEAGLLQTTSRTTGRREFLFDDLVTFATRYFHLDADSAQQVVFSLCNRSEQLRDAPIRRSLDVDGVTKIPTAVRARFDLDTVFYGKHVDADGISVIASPKVPDEALLVARDIINHMLMARADIRADMIKRGARLGVIATADSLLDVPEYRDWKKPGRRDQRLTDQERALYDQPGGIASMTARQYWNRRARGMGGTYTTTSEENLLGYPGSRDFGWGLTVHEFAHNIHSSVRRVDSKLNKELEVAYKEAMAKKMYLYASGQRAGTVNTIDEYWAEGTQWWFWNNASRVFLTDGVVQTVWSPDDLQRYDPKLYSILSRVYADHRIPADVYHGKKW